MSVMSNGTQESIRTEMVKIVIGFVLSSVVGAFIGSWLQYRIWTDQYRIQSLERDRTNATEILQRTSSVMSKRYYNMAKLTYMIKIGEDLAEVKKQWIVHFDAGGEWAQSYQLDSALVKWYFGDESKKKFDQMAAQSNEISEKITSAYFSYIENQENRKNVDYPAIDEKLAFFGNSILTWDYEMVDVIQKGEIGQFRSNQK